jgi:hypothetical protein
MGNSASAKAFRNNSNNALASGKTFASLTDEEWEKYINDRFYGLDGNTVEIYDKYEFSVGDKDIS